tara:strand:+ start:138 stop:446 length:309 start_codon:yes stop_codon:yes gene_type:complete
MITHKYDIRKTKHDPSTGLITKITFSLVTFEGDNYWHKKYECDLTGSPSDSGFIPFNDLTQSDIEGFIDSVLTKSTLESANSASLATHVESLAYSDDLPPNL